MRQCYAITSGGRRALQAWLAQPSAPPDLEFEGLLRVLYADQTDREALVATLEGIVEHARARLAIGNAPARQYVESVAPYPERMHVNALVWEYLRRHHQTMLDWPTWAKAIVRTWGTVQCTPAKQAEGLAIFQAGIASA